VIALLLAQAREEVSMRLPRIRRALCALVVLAATAVGVQAAYGWTGTSYFSGTAGPGNPQYTAGWAYRNGNRMDTGTGFLPVEVWSLTTGYVVTNDVVGAGWIEYSYPAIYRRQGCWNPGIAPYTYPYYFACAWA
jgi:hypothetical protein